MLGPARAQDALPNPDLPHDLTTTEISEFIAQLSDEQVRKLLIAQLQKMSAEAAVTGAGEDMDAMTGFIDTMESDAARASERLVELLAAPKNGPQVVSEIFEEPTQRGGILGLLIIAIVLVAAGVLAEWLVKRPTVDVRARVDQCPEGSVSVKLCNLGLRATIDLLSIAVFAGGILGAFVLLGGGDLGRRFVATYLLVIVMVRLASIVSRFFMSPRARQLRLLPISDADAVYYHRWILWIVGVGAFGSLTISLLELRGTTEAVQILQTAMVSLVVAIMLSTLVFQQRRQVASLIRGGVDSTEAKASADPIVRVRAQLADIWHVLAAVYIFGIWGMKFLSMLIDREVATGAPIFSLAIVLHIPAVDWLIGRGLVRIFSKRVEEAESIKLITTVHDKRNIAAIRRGIRILLVILCFAGLLAAWGFDFGSATAYPFAAMVARPVISITVILILTYVAWELTKVAIDRRLESEGGDLSAGGGADAEEGSGDPGTRLQTLLPLLRKFMIGTLSVVVVLSGLWSRISQVTDPSDADCV